MQSGRFVFAMLFVSAAAATVLFAAPENVPRRYRLTCDSLTITKGEELTDIALSGGVKLIGRDGRRIASDTGLVRVVSKVITETVRSGKTAAKAQAAPAASGTAQPGEFTPAEIRPEDMKRIELSGNVVMTGAEGVLTCDAVYSDDGGVTWNTKGASTFKGGGKNDGMSLSAAGIKLDVAKRTVSGAGGVSIIIPAPKDGAGVGASGGSPIKVSAESFSYDTDRSVLTLAGRPTVRQAGSTAAASNMKYFGESGRIETAGGVSISFPEKNIAATGNSATYSPDGKALFSGNVLIVDKENEAALYCDRLTYDGRTGDIKAEGHARLSYEKERIELSADAIVGNLESEAGSATGNPVIKRGKSTASGKEIKFKRSGGRITVEILGKDKTEFVVYPEDIKDAQQALP